MVRVSIHCSRNKRKRESHWCTEVLCFSVTKCQDEIQNGAGDVRDGWFLTHNTKDRVIEHASAHSFIAWITTVSEVACQLRRKQERKCPDRYTVSGSITTLEYKACASPETHYCCSRSKKNTPQTTASAQNLPKGLLLQPNRQTDLTPPARAEKENLKVCLTLKSHKTESKVHVTSVVLDLTPSKE